MSTAAELEFTVSAQSRKATRVRLRRVMERWVAEVDGIRSHVGLGSTARAALVAALEPLSADETQMLLVDLSLLGPSIRVLEIESAATI